MLIGPAISICSVSGPRAPVVSSLSYDVGDTAGGTPITISGLNLGAMTGGTIGGVALTSFTVVDSTTITAVTGAHAKGVVDVVLTGTSGSVTVANGFEYWNPSSVAECIWWLRADLGVTVDGSNNVTGWADQSGLGDANRNLTPEATPPVRTASVAAYNSKATVNAWTNRLVTGTWSASYSSFLLGIIGHADATGNRYFTKASDTDFIALLNVNDLPLIYSGGATSNVNGGSGLSTPKCSVIGEWAEASSAIYVNATSTPTASGTLEAATLGDEPIGVGAHPAGAAFAIDSLAELYAFSALSAANAVKLRKYLNGRYAKAMSA